MLSWRWLGRMPYAVATAEQEALRAQVLDGDDRAMCVLLLEHDPVITLGRRGDSEHVLLSERERQEQGVELVRTSRGGDVTYHGPGQLVIYPVVRIAGSVVGFLAAIAGALAEVTSELGVPGARWERDPAGLWLGSDKLAACGIHLRRRVTCHGFAFNVATPPEVWEWIVPCGLTDRGVTSIAEECARGGLGPPPTVVEVAEMAGPRICEALEPVISGVER